MWLRWMPLVLFSPIPFTMLFRLFCALFHLSFVFFVFFLVPVLVPCFSVVLAIAWLVSIKNCIFWVFFLRILPVHLQRQTCKLHLPKHVPESFNNVRYMYGGVSWKMYITSSRFKGFLDFQRGCICSCCDKGKEGLLGMVYPLQTCTPEVF